MIVRPRARTLKVAAVAATAVLVTALLNAASAPAASAHGSPVPGNQTCADLIPGSLEYKVEPVTSGSYTNGTLTVNLSVYNLAADAPESGNQTGSPVFDFTASGGVVTGVGVKGGPNTNFFDYRPGGVVGDTRMHAPVNANNGKFYGLSHVSFCYVPKARPKITTKVSDPEITIGGSVKDTATLTAGHAPTGAITFKVYGPDDATCTGAVVFTSTVPVSGNGTYPSAAFTPAAVGTYRWIASYGGDIRNEAATGVCNEADEQVLVKKARPTLVTAPDVLPNDTATVTGLVAPSGGTITFKLYTNDTCTSPVVYSEVQAVGANGSFKTSNTSVRVTSDTTIGWIVAYSGDAKNEAATSGCTDEQIVLDFTPLN